MTTTYVLDTSVLLSDPKALFAFAEHEVVLPLVVIKELEGKRNDPELGHPARVTLRAIEVLRCQEGANLRAGVPVGTMGGTVRIEINHVSAAHLPTALQGDLTHDTRILAVAKNLMVGDPSRTVILVSKDVPMRILADSVGVASQEYLREQKGVDDHYTGVAVADVSKSVVDALYASEKKVLRIASAHGVPDSLPVHTGVILPGALARVGKSGDLHLIDPNATAFGFRPGSAEQRIALANLLDPSIGIVSLGGKAGTGKSVLALAAALELIMERRAQKKIIVFRPLFSVGGQDLGFLPGSEAEKMGPWGAAVHDALQFLGEPTTVEEILARGLVEVAPLTHIRGRTFTDTIIIVDFISYTLTARDVRRHRRGTLSRTACAPMFATRYTDWTRGSTDATNARFGRRGVECRQPSAVRSSTRESSRRVAHLGNPGCAKRPGALAV